MQLFNLKSMEAFPYEQRDKNELYRAENFKVRIIELQPGEKLPPEEPCKMETHVIFYVVSGRIGLTVNEEYRELEEGACFVSEPAYYQMEAKEHTKLMGVQIAENNPQ